MSLKVKAHGFDGDLVDPDWPFLTLEEVDKLLRRYPQAAGAGQLLSFSPRPFSAASVVETRQGKVLVKRHHQRIRTRQGLLEEHRLMAHLASRGALVNKVLADVSGETAIAAGEWTYEVHAVAAGVDLYEQAPSWTPFLSVNHAYAAGRALAQLHLAAQDYDAPARQSRPLVASFSIFAAQDAEPELEKYVKARPALAEYLAEHNWKRDFAMTLLPFHAKLRPWLQHLQPLWTHNDLHASNLIWSDETQSAEVTAIIDFGLADRTNAMHDLATAIERNAIAWLTLPAVSERMVRFDQVDALLDGYEETRALTEPEGFGLVAMLPLVHAEFALSEADYFLSILHSPERAALAYDGYFLGHARWFQSEAGQQLLNHLEKRARERRRYQSQQPRARRPVRVAL